MKMLVQGSIVLLFFFIDQVTSARKQLSDLAIFESSCHLSISSKMKASC